MPKTSRTARSAAPTRLAAAPAFSLRGYLATGAAGAALCVPTVAQGQPIAINLGPTGHNLLGLNAGLAPNTSRTVTDFGGFTGFNFVIRNRASNPDGTGYTDATGFYSNELQNVLFKLQLTPTRENWIVGTYAPGASIDGSDFGGWGSPYFKFTNPSWSETKEAASFSRQFVGFRFFLAGGDYRYGWIEASWDATTENFEFFSACHETQINTAIEAGACSGGAVVPEPASLSLVGLGALALGAGAARRNRQARRRDAVAA